MWRKEEYMTAFISIRFLDVIDIFLVSVLFYELYNILKGTAAIKISLGIIGILLFWLLVSSLEMELLSKIFGAFISVGIIALIVVFQPEIRRFLFLLGTRNTFGNLQTKVFFKNFAFSKKKKLSLVPIITACEEMALSHTGALIVLTKENSLKQYIETGETVDAKISSILLQSIFFKNSPLHDGAVIVTEDKILAARCVLPVSDSHNFPSRYGLRHRSAVGITEYTDAIAIVVSEEKGRISYAKSGKLHLNVSTEELSKMLELEYNIYSI